jgi:ribosome maturation protein Sdo1
MADAETESKPVDPDALVADIDRTRAQLASTIDAITDRVSPKKNVERALEQARERVSQAQRALEQVRDRVSQIDPIMAGAAAAAIAIGVTALILLRRRRH